MRHAAELALVNHTSHFMSAVQHCNPSRSQEAAAYRHEDHMIALDASDLFHAGLMSASMARTQGDGKMILILPSVTSGFARGQYYAPQRLMTPSESHPAHVAMLCV